MILNAGDTEAPDAIVTLAGTVNCVVSEEVRLIIEGVAPTTALVYANTHEADVPAITWRVPVVSMQEVDVDVAVAQVGTVGQVNVASNLTTFLTLNTADAVCGGVPVTPVPDTVWA